MDAIATQSVDPVKVSSSAAGNPAAGNAVKDSFWTLIAFGTVQVSHFTWQVELASSAGR